MDMTTVVGIVAGLVCVTISIMNTGRVSDFLDMPSVFIVIGGVLCATLASFPMDRIKSLLKALKSAFRKNTTNINDDIELLIKLANIARKEGILALEESAAETEEPFLKKGIMLIVDGTDPELIKDILETDLEFIKQRHADSRAILDAAASYSPAFGMIGTLIGLINMLQHLTDMAALGPNMATALITTFYGSMLANLVFGPLSKKLKAAGTKEYLRKEMVLEGLLSIQNGENPRIIREKLNAFLPREQLQKMEAQTGGKQKGEPENVKE